jgi:aminoglycoside phosphotransferase (APT) family kinase protein
MDLSLDPNVTAPVRDGEQLDAARLGEYLRALSPDFQGRIDIEQFPAGHSNLTYLVRAGARELVLRRPPFGSRVISAHDMSREFRVLSRLHPLYAPAPRPIAYCDDASVLGAPFYLMERRRGLVVRKEFPARLARSPATLRRIAESLVDNLGALHAIDLHATGLAAIGKPEGYVRRQVEGWTRRWSDARTEDVPEVERVAGWLADRLPPESGASLIHNDYKLDNVMLDPADPARIVAVLDWEMATVGDPLMDLGAALAYWVEAGDPGEFLAQRLAPTAQPGFLTRREAAARYASATGRDLANVAYYYVFGLFKTAVVIQQIYYRWVHGHTRDERFAGFGAMVVALARQAAAAAGRESV